MSIGHEKPPKSWSELRRAIGSTEFRKAAFSLALTPTSPYEAGKNLKRWGLVNVIESAVNLYVNWEKKGVLRRFSGPSDSRGKGRAKEVQVDYETIYASICKEIGLNKTESKILVRLAKTFGPYFKELVMRIEPERMVLQGLEGRGVEGVESLPESIVLLPVGIFVLTTHDQFYRSLFEQIMGFKLEPPSGLQEKVKEVMSNPSYSGVALKAMTFMTARCFASAPLMSILTGLTNKVLEKQGTGSFIQFE